MSKIAIVVLTDVDNADGLGRIVNALTAAKEFKEHQDTVQVIFSGAGTKWIGTLEDKTHKLHGLYAGVKDLVQGACGFCATAFGVESHVQACGIKSLKEYGDNMSFRNLVQGGFQILIF